MQEIVKKRVKDIEIFMSEVSKLRKDKRLDEDIFNQCSDYIEESTTNSTRFLFAENEFYKLLPSVLQINLAESVLHHERNVLDHFFEDRNGRNSASDHFVNAVVTQLESALYKAGDTIISAREPVRDLVFIANGTCKLYGSYHSKRDKEKLLKLCVVRLREGSWYGDF